MKKHLLTICVILLGFYTYGQNNVYGKKVVALDSIVTNAINARSGSEVKVTTTLNIADILELNGINLRNKIDNNSNLSLGTSNVTLQADQTLFLEAKKGSSSGQIEFDIDGTTEGIITDTNFDFQSNDLIDIGSLTVDNLRLDGNTISSTSAEITIDAVSSVRIENLTIGTNLSTVAGDLKINPHSGITDFSNSTIDDVGSLTVDDLTLDGNDITSTSELGINTGGTVDVNVGGSTKFLFDVSDEDFVVGGSARYGEFDFTAPVNYSINTGDDLTLNSDNLYLDYNDDNDGSDLFIRSNNSNVVTINSTGTWDFNTNDLTDIGGLTVDSLTLDANQLNFSATTPTNGSNIVLIRGLSSGVQSGSITIDASEDHSVGNLGSEISFFTVDNGTTTSDERLLIGNDGTFNFNTNDLTDIGTTDTDSLYVSGNSNLVGTLDVGGNGTFSGDVTIVGKTSIGDGSELTIATGSITITTGFHEVDTEGDAATDDLETINGGIDGQIIVINARNAARTVVLKDNTGNLRLAGDFSMDNRQDRIMLIYDTSTAIWNEISRSDNGI